MVAIGREICVTLPSSLAREWLVTNGLGGYASSSLVGANTRRYHGLLVAALRPPYGRTVLLSKIDEELTVGDRTYYLGTNEYRGEYVHPSGFVHLEEVALDGTIPTFTFGTSDARLEKTVWMEHGRNTTYVSYYLHPRSRPATLRLLPFTTYRDYHRQTAGAAEWHFGTEALPDGCIITAFPGAVPFRLLSVPVATFIPTGVWYWRYVHRQERDRGMDFFEDLHFPGLFTHMLQPGDRLTLVATVEQPEAVDGDVSASLAREQSRQRDLIARASTRLPLGVPEPERLFRDQLVLAADQFLVSGGDSPASCSEVPDRLLAGYHWLGEWGRDAMIALPGLALATGRAPVAAAVLRRFAGFLDEGRLPSHFPEYGGGAEYRGADVALWYFQALDRYLQATDDEGLLAEVFPVLVSIVECYCAGTDGIAVDAADGLLRADSPHMPLTWMDAQVDDWIVTPRRGKPVEINALWCNALALLRKWAERLGRPDMKYRDMALAAKASFARRFWSQEHGYLFDVVDGEGGDDPALRPNQILAVALPQRLLAPEQERAVVEIVARRLLTSRGLRTLDPADPRYRGRYEGDRRARDAAFHQGTVWSWLIGPFVDAFLRVYRDKQSAQRLLLPLREYLLEGGLGTIGDTCMGQEPHLPCGCVSEARGVAEVLRAWDAVTCFVEAVEDKTVGPQRERLAADLAD